MILIEYANDFQKNYLVMEFLEEGFELMMLKTNNIYGLLQVQERQVDGRKLLYYDISGKQSLENCFASKTISRERLFTFLHDWYRVSRLRQEFFLIHGELMLTPETIFWNMDEDRFEFLFYPDKEIMHSLEVLGDFLMKKVDSSDYALAQFVFEICKDLYSGHAMVEKYIEQECDFVEVLKQEEQEAMLLSEGTGNLTEEKETICMKKSGSMEYPVSREIWEEEHNGDGLIKESENNKGKRRPLVVILILFGMVGILLFFHMIRQEWMRMMLIIILILSVCLIVNRGRKKIEKRKESNKNEEDNEILFEPDYEECKFVKREEFRTVDKTSETLEEKTVFMDLTQIQENKLYSIGKNKQKSISLEKVPLIIGKDNKMSDFVIQDSSVSRMQVKFYREQEELWMQDLNSTNGTFYNGLRLKPNERVQIRSEDEIGIGKLRFIYR